MSKNNYRDGITRRMRVDFYLIEEIRKCEASILRIAKTGLHLKQSQHSGLWHITFNEIKSKMDSLTDELLFHNSGFTNIHDITKKFSEQCKTYLQPTKSEPLPENTSTYLTQNQNK